MGSPKIICNLYSLFGFYLLYSMANFTITNIF